MAGVVALFGGSFNPVHNGHLIAVRAVAEQLNAGRTVFIPSANPPHKRQGDLAEASHRLEMVKLATAGEPGWEVSDCEICRRGPSYTIDTVAHFRRELGAGVELCWVIGADSLTELVGWHRIGDLVEQCRIVTMARPGWDRPDLSVLRTRLSDVQTERLVRDVLATPRIDISATDIRRRIREDLSVRYLVPDSVLEYIRAKRLYLGGRCPDAAEGDI